MESRCVLYDGMPAAILSERDEGYTLQYDAQYLEQPGSKHISLTLLKKRSLQQQNIVRFF